MWDEVALYIESTYDMDYLENVFILGDGAKWIRIGTTWINKSVSVLDKFHKKLTLSKFTKILN